LNSRGMKEIKRWTETTKGEKKPPKYFREKVTSTVGEATRDNLPYKKGNQSPIQETLKGRSGF